MTLYLVKEEVDPWPMNCSILICEESHRSAVIDPGVGTARILQLIKGTQLDMILLAHGHFDHVGAVQEIEYFTHAPIYLHPADAAHFDLPFDVALTNSDRLQVDHHTLYTIHVPGQHPRPGMLRFGRPTCHQQRYPLRGRAGQNFIAGRFSIDHAQPAAHHLSST